MTIPKISWPDGHLFAFSIFDDTDRATVENVGPVYAFLEDIGLRTTKSVWPLGGSQKPNIGDTCENPQYLTWVKGLQDKGFEIGHHLSTCHTSSRDQSLAGFQKFHQLFASWPKTSANHTGCQESIYWGQYRLNGINRLIYNILTRGKNKKISHGHMEGDPLFWGDYCKRYVTYVRNFVFSEMNTLKACPFMPYHDPDRPYVNWWFASSEGPNLDSFIRTVSEENQDRLEAEGGACIMYSHLAAGFYQQGCLNQRFKILMERLSKKNGWFVPVSTLLDYLRTQNGGRIITPRERRLIELKWLAHKIRLGGVT